MRESLASLGKNLIGSLESRLDLAQLEASDELRRYFILLVAALAVAGLMQLCLLFAALALFFILNTGAPAVAAGYVALIFGGLGLVVLLATWLTLRRRPEPFSETRAVLREDQSWLAGKEHE